MIKKKIGALLGCLLMASAMPFAMAHTSSSDRDVSGNYYGGAGAYTVVDGQEFVAGSMLCDAEVLGDGTAPDDLDETDVDGKPGGNQPNGFFDDGGQGGVCHTSNQYAYGDYNSPGCGTDDEGGHAYMGDAFAIDAESADVWISTSCDWKSTSGGPSLTGCLINEVISGADPGTLVACLNTWLNNQGGDFESCGADSNSDAGAFGYGSAGVAFPAATLITDDGCVMDDASAAVFAFADGHTDHVPTAGHIWQGAGSVPPPPTGPRTATWLGAATVVVEGFPASADEGFVACSQARGGAGIGGFCVFEDVAAVYVEDFVEGADIAFQVCRDINNDQTCTNEETRFSHSNSGLIENPVEVPSGTGQVVVFICKGAHSTHSGPHEHHATVGTWEKRDTGEGFTDPDAYCGGSTGGGGNNPPPVGKRYVITP